MGGGGHRRIKGGGYGEKKQGGSAGADSELLIYSAIQEREKGRVSWWGERGGSAAFSGFQDHGFGPDTFLRRPSALDGPRP